jgi:GNAT superfamily N-acetyltransferase
MSSPYQSTTANPVPSTKLGMGDHGVASPVHPGQDRPDAGIEIQHLHRGDVELMGRLLEGLSARDRYLRFLAPTPRLPARALRALADADGARHVVLVAFRGDRPIGEGRFNRPTTESDTADLAVSVVSDQQQRGVGRALVAALAVEADRRNIRRFTFDVSPENRVVVSMLKRWQARLRLADRLVSGDVLVAAILAADQLDTTSLNPTAGAQAA